MSKKGQTQKKIHGTGKGPDHLGCQKKKGKRFWNMMVKGCAKRKRRAIIKDIESNRGFCVFLYQFTIVFALSFFSISLN